MARVKVVMGFVILAARLKYLSSLDQVLQWNFLTRERFLAAWIVLFAMAGLYLLGFVRLEGIKPDEQHGTRPPADRHGISDLRDQSGARHVRRHARRAGRLCPVGHASAGSAAPAAKRRWSG